MSKLLQERWVRLAFGSNLINETGSDDSLTKLQKDRRAAAKSADPDVRYSEEYLAARPAQEVYDDESGNIIVKAAEPAKKFTDPGRSGQSSALGGAAPQVQVAMMVQRAATANGITGLTIKLAEVGKGDGDVELEIGGTKIGEIEVKGSGGGTVDADPPTLAKFKQKFQNELGLVMLNANNTGLKIILWSNNPQHAQIKQMLAGVKYDVMDSDDFTDAWWPLQSAKPERSDRGNSRPIDMEMIETIIAAPRPNPAFDPKQPESATNAQNLPAIVPSTLDVSMDSSKPASANNVQIDPSSGYKEFIVDYLMGRTQTRRRRDFVEMLGDMRYVEDPIDITEQEFLDLQSALNSRGDTALPFVGVFDQNRTYPFLPATPNDAGSGGAFNMDPTKKDMGRLLWALNWFVKEGKAAAEARIKAGTYTTYTTQKTGIGYHQTPPKPLSNANLRKDFERASALSADGTWETVRGDKETLEWVKNNLSQLDIFNKSELIGLSSKYSIGRPRQSWSKSEIKQHIADNIQAAINAAAETNTRIEAKAERELAAWQLHNWQKLNNQWREEANQEMLANLQQTVTADTDNDIEIPTQVYTVPTEGEDSLVDLWNANAPEEIDTTVRLPESRRSKYSLVESLLKEAADAELLVLSVLAGTTDIEDLPPEFIEALLGDEVN